MKINAQQMEYRDLPSKTGNPEAIKQEIEIIDCIKFKTFVWQNIP